MAIFGGYFGYFLPNSCFLFHLLSSTHSTQSSGHFGMCQYFDTWMRVVELVGGFLPFEFLPVEYLPVVKNTHGKFAYRNFTRRKSAHRMTHRNSARGILPVGILRVGNLPIGILNNGIFPTGILPTGNLPSRCHCPCKALHNARFCTHLVCSASQLSRLNAKQFSSYELLLNRLNLLMDVRAPSSDQYFFGYFYFIFLTVWGKNS